MFENGVEELRVNVALAIAIPNECCEKINLGYMNPAQIKIADSEDREHEGVLVVPHGGEILHRLVPAAASAVP